MGEERKEEKWKMKRRKRVGGVEWEMKSRKEKRKREGGV